jgi:hypothetical protein
MSEQADSKKLVEKAADSSSQILRRDNEEYTVVKKLPGRFPTDFNHIYVTNKTDIRAQLNKCNKIIHDSMNVNNDKVEVWLHAMGPAINRSRKKKHIADYVSFCYF